MPDLEVGATIAWHRLNWPQWKADLQRPGNIFKAAPQNRFALRRRWAAALALCLGLSSHGETPHHPPYLPAVGPAPLRFLAIAVPPTNDFKLPPPPPPVVVEEPKTQPPTNNAESVITKVSSAPPVQTNEIGGSADVTPDGVVSPQMLLKFFNKSTNGPSPTVIAPMDFRPPNPAPPSSKASYSTGP